MVFLRIHARIIVIGLHAIPTFLPNFFGFCIGNIAPRKDIYIYTYTYKTSQSLLFFLFHQPFFITSDVCLDKEKNFLSVGL